MAASSSQVHRPDLPLFGPLDIQNYGEHTNKQKILFHKRYKSHFPNLADLDNFNYLYILGRGDFGSMVVVQRKDEETLLAMRIIIKKRLVDNLSVDKILNEKRILQSLDCPFCIRLEYFYQDSSKLYFLLPFISGGEVFTHLQKNHKFEESISRFFAAQVILALEYLHCCDVVHRDLKPENLHLDHLGCLKIIKFGHAKVVSDRTYTVCGIPEYMAPEMIAGKGYGKSVDWWALGVLIYEMNTGHPPFISSNFQQTYKKISSLTYTMPNSFSNELKDLVRRLLQSDISKRAGNSTQGDIKGHKWFKDVHWLDILNRKTVPPFIPNNYRSSLNYPSLTKDTVDMSSPSNREDLDVYFKDF